MITEYSIIKLNELVLVSCLSRIQFSN